MPLEIAQAMLRLLATPRTTPFLPWSRFSTFMSLSVKGGKDLGGYIRSFKETAKQGLRAGIVMDLKWLGKIFFADRSI